MEISEMARLAHIGITLQSIQASLDTVEVNLAIRAEEPQGLDEVRLRSMTGAIRATRRQAWKAARLEKQNDDQTTEEREQPGENKMNTTQIDRLLETLMNIQALLKDILASLNRIEALERRKEKDGG